MANKLKKRIADLLAVDAVIGLPIGGCPKNGNQSVYEVSLCDNYVLSLCANHRRNPTLENGEVDWSKVRNVKITGIEKRNE